MAMMATAMMGSSLAASPLSALSKPTMCSSFSGTKLCPKLPVLPFTAVPGSLQIEAMKKIQGRVVCASSDKTIAVEVTRIAPHPKYKKRVKTTKKYHVHDPANSCKVGDVVTVAKCAPVSKSKTFIVVDIKAGRKPGTRLPAPTLPPLESAVTA